jgi:hypothetical protein
MKEYLAPRIVDVARRILSCSAWCQKGGDLDSDTWGLISSNASWIASEAEHFGFGATQAQAKRIIYFCSQGSNAGTILAAANELETRFNDEVKAVCLLNVELSKLRFYSATDLFGEEFKVNFPVANGEICEAGKCLALDRYTACAFHLMRAMEIALRVLFTSLGMQPRILSVTKWEAITDRIGARIAKNDVHRADDMGWQAERLFYDEALAFLVAARSPLRNATMHVDVSYADEGSILPVWLATEAFMRHIAPKLRE